MAANIQDLKKEIFYEILNMVGRVFILVGYADDVIIGNRGFLPEEKEKGLVLVFNGKMHFEWDDQGISARLVFGSKTEKCFVPSEMILSVFSPELSAHFSVAQSGTEQTISAPKKARKTAVHNETGTNVVKVDFGKKK